MVWVFGFDLFDDGKALFVFAEGGGMEPNCFVCRGDGGFEGGEYFFPTVDKQLDFWAEGRDQF